MYSITYIYIHINTGMVDFLSTVSTQYIYIYFSHKFHHLLYIPSFCVRQTLHFCLAPTLNWFFRSILHGSRHFETKICIPHPIRSSPRFSSRIIDELNSFWRRWDNLWSSQKSDDLHHFPMFLRFFFKIIHHFPSIIPVLGWDFLLDPFEDANGASCGQMRAAGARCAGSWAWFYGTRFISSKS